jgi:RNA polymerase sigma factor (sigma-70 family)
MENDPFNARRDNRDDDLPLIQAIATGDDPALDTLMQRHHDALFAFIFRYLGNETEARDAVEETFVRVYFKAATFRPGCKVKTWIYCIALNQCRDLARRRGRMPVMIRLDDPVGESGAPRQIANPCAMPDASASQAERFFRLREAIDRLPERSKAAIVLCALEERSHKEAAEILGIAPKTVENLVYRAKAKLREWLSLEEAADSQTEACEASAA